MTVRLCVGSDVSSDRGVMNADGAPPAQRRNHSGSSADSSRRERPQLNDFTEPKVHVMGGSGSKDLPPVQRRAQPTARGGTAHRYAPAASNSSGRGGCTDRHDALARARKAQLKAEAAAAAAIVKPVLTEALADALNVQLPPEGRVEEWVALENGSFARSAADIAEVWLIRDGGAPLGLEVSAANSIVTVAEGSVAAAAGLCAGDVVVAVSVPAAGGGGSATSEPHGSRHTTVALGREADSSEPVRMRLSDAVLEACRAAGTPPDLLVLTLRRHEITAVSDGAGGGGAGGGNHTGGVGAAVGYTEQPGFAEAEAKARAASAASEGTSASGAGGVQGDGEASGDTATAWAAVRIPRSARWLALLVEVNQHGVGLYACEAHRDAGAVYAQVRRAPPPPLCRVPPATAAGERTLLPHSLQKKCLDYRLPTSLPPPPPLPHRSHSLSCSGFTAPPTTVPSPSLSARLLGPPASIWSLDPATPASGSSEPSAPPPPPPAHPPWRGSLRPRPPSPD